MKAEVGKVGWDKIMENLYCHVKKFDLHSIGNGSYQVFEQGCYDLGLIGRDLRSLLGLCYRI